MTLLPLGYIWESVLENQESGCCDRKRADHAPPAAKEAPLLTAAENTLFSAKAGCAEIPSLIHQTLLVYFFTTLQKHIAFQPQSPIPYYCPVPAFV